MVEIEGGPWAVAEAAIKELWKTGQPTRALKAVLEAAVVATAERDRATPGGGRQQCQP